jgi:hypothetical protein
METVIRKMVNDGKGCSEKHPDGKINARRGDLAAGLYRV